MTDKHFLPQSQDAADSGISRRKMLLGMTAATAAAFSGNALSGDSGHDHSHHDHSKHAPQQPDLLNAINICEDKGQLCIAHCLVSFTEGSTELAKCATKVQEMQAVCNAFSYLVVSNSKYTKEFSEVCAKICKDCEDECMKHKEHIECKACGEACGDLLDQIKLRLS